MSLFSSLKPKAQLSRNVFDLSRSETFSTKLGMITPCFCMETVPDGKYKINMSDICRVDSQVTANFTGFNQVFDFYFVPYSQLWSKFNRFYYGKGEITRNDNTSNGVSSTVQPTMLPSFEIKPVFQELFYAIYFWTCYDYAISKTLESGIIPTAMRTWAENKGITLRSGTTWQASKFIDVHGRFCGYDMLRTLDMLGYGNFLPIVKYSLPTDFSEVLADMSIEVSSSTAKPITAAADLAWSKIEHLVPTNRVCPFALQAYLKVWNDIYKNRFYDNYQYQMVYNSDWFSGTGGESLPSQLYFNLFKPFYRQYKKDLFTAGYPSPQFGSVAVAALSNPSQIASSVDGGGNDVIQTKDGYLALSKDGSFVARSSLWNISSAVSALAMRQAFALQRYKEKLVRAGNRLKDLQEAIFGVGSKYIEDSYVDFLGSFQTALQLNPVAATAQGDGSNLGDLGGYSVGSIDMGSQREIEFDAKDFGVIIGVCYVMPEAKYEAYGIEPLNTRNVKDDFFNPVLQNLGLAPVYSYHINYFGLGNDEPSASVLGYSAEYWDYKTKVSRVHGEFFGSNPAIPLKYDTVTGYDADVYTRQQLNSAGAFNQFVSTRDVRDMSSISLQSLYIAPWDADRVFNVADNIPQAFDHYKFECSFRVKAVLPMNVIGLPE